MKFEKIYRVHFSMSFENQIELFFFVMPQRIASALFFLFANQHKLWEKHNSNKPIKKVDA